MLYVMLCTCCFAFPLQVAYLLDTQAPPIVVGTSFYPPLPQDSSPVELTESIQHDCPVGCKAREVSKAFQAEIRRQKNCEEGACRS